MGAWDTVFAPKTGKGLVRNGKNTVTTPLQTGRTDPPAEKQAIRTQTLAKASPGIGNIERQRKKKGLTDKVL